MKKYFKKLCACVLIWLLVCTVTSAAEAAENYIVLHGFAFDINADGKAVIHSYDDRSPQVVIPHRLMSADVTAIDDYAFFRDAVITSVSFEQATALKTVGANAFNGCSALTSLTIPEQIETLSFGSFQNCSSLAELHIEGGVTRIPGQCFYGCASLTRVALPETITEIGERAFMNCAGLKAVGIPDTAQTIADNAFDGCSSLVIYCTKESRARQYAAQHGIDCAITNPDPVTFLRGDADGEGRITILDATMIQRLLAGLIADNDGMIELRGDVCDDGLDILDATLIQRFLADFDNIFGVGEEVTVTPLPPDING